MAKQRAQAKGGGAKVRLAAPRGPKFFAFSPQQSIAPHIREEKHTTDPWVWHGSNNLFPEHVRALFDNVGPLGRCGSLGGQFIAGHGMTFHKKDGTEIPEAQALFQTWMGGDSEEEFLSRMGYDAAHGLGITMTVRRSATGDIVRLNHLDRFSVRSGKMVDGKDSDGLPTKKVAQYFVSRDWARYHENTSDEEYAPKAIPAFDFSENGRLDPIACIFKYDYRPLEPIYGLVFWLGAYVAAEVWQRVDLYNRTQIDTGFAPAVILGTVFDGTDSQKDDYDKKVEDTFGKATGRGIYHVIMGNPEDKPFVQVLERGNHAGELDEMRNSAADVIYDVYGIPSLLLRDREAGLTSQERAIAMRLQQFQRTFVEPIQKKITQPIAKLMNMSGIDVWEARITPLKIFDPVQSEAIIMASTTVDEAREQRGEEELGGEDGDKLLVTVKAVAPVQDEQGTAPLKKVKP